MKKRGELIGTILAVLGILLAIFAIPPESWVSNFGIWGTYIRSTGIYVATFLIGVVFTIIIYQSINSRRNRSLLRVLSGDEYAKEFQNRLKSGKYPIVKIFGYTGEVVTNDLITYLDRYHSGLEIRLLHRNWIVEREDEDTHNRGIERLGFRLWDKSKAIKNLAVEDWEHPLKREIRYYSHQPILKGAVFCDANDKPLLVFLNFQKWVPLPVEGGSEFKSVPSDMIMLSKNENPVFQDIMERINTQFEYEWSFGKTKKDLIELDSGSPKTPLHNQRVSNRKKERK